MTYHGHTPGTQALLLRRCLSAGGLAPARLDRAMARARRLGVPLERVLFAEDATLEAGTVERVARRFGMATRVETASRPHPAGCAATVLEDGCLRFTDGTVVMILSERTARRLIEAALRREPVVLVTGQAFLDIVMSVFAGPIATEASQGLFWRNPRLSLQGTPLRRDALMVLLAGALVVASLAIGPAWLALLLVVVLFCFFLWGSVIRLAACCEPPPERSTLVRIAAARLPVYTLLVPLHDEAEVLAKLVLALTRLDWPAEKLDIILLVEADDRRTLEGLAELALPGSVRVLRVPPGAPRTKPRALNAGLMAARGAFVTVFDAEDVPDRCQLRRAHAAFVAGGPTLAVVQAMLAIDPRQTGWRTALFRLEYAGLFHVLLPFLAARGYPLPLGGTSNHFRRAVLERLGGWDAWNVTEDADLGLRLHRCGWRATVIPSCTGEEAPPTADAWLKQRTRWLKGWMATLIVHGQQPGHLLRQVGVGGALAFLTVVGGIVVAALAEPLALAVIVWRIAAGTLVQPAGTLGDALVVSAGAVTFTAGHVGALAAGVIGLRRAGQPVGAGLVLLLPVYWLAISVAAWRAVWQLLTRPSHWEKTPHVVAGYRAAVQPASETQRPRGTRERREDVRTVHGPQPHRADHEDRRDERRDPAFRFDRAAQGPHQRDNAS